MTVRMSGNINITREIIIKTLVPEVVTHLAITVTNGGADVTHGVLNQ